MHETTVSRTVEWYTPRWIFQAIGQVFDLDPCAPQGDYPGAEWCRTRLTLPERDGLTEPWEGNLVWLNPPFGPGIDKWLRKAAEHGGVIALVPARTETRWFQEAMGTARVALLLDGRVSFVSPTGEMQRGNTVGSVFLGWGYMAERALVGSDLPGHCVQKVGR